MEKTYKTIGESEPLVMQVNGMIIFMLTTQLLMVGLQQVM